MTTTNRPTVQVATKTFVEIFSESGTADSIGAALSCIEVDTLTALLRAAGASHAADKWLADHALGDDDEGDLHYDEAVAA
jgi:hypothetical protein